MVFPPAACFTTFPEEATGEKMQIPYTAFRECGAVMLL